MVGPVPFGPSGPAQFTSRPLGQNLVPIDQGTPAYAYQTWPGKGPNPTQRIAPAIRGERIVPSDLGRTPFFIFPGAGPRRPFMFQPRWLSLAQFALSGVIRDQAKVAIAGCVVELFRTDDNVFLSKTNSDAGGNYIFSPVGAGPFFIVAYKSGAPDLAGTSVNTLRGS